MRPVAAAELACPWCLGALRESEAGLHCGACPREYARDARGRPDLRLGVAARMAFEYRYDPTWGVFPWEKARTRFPEVTGAVSAPHWAAAENEILRSIPPARAGERALDLGCGADHKRFAEPLAQLGYVPTGVDIEGTEPDVWGDLHALPFPDASFDLLVTSAVFEHVKEPHVAMAEAARVCRAGALFVGTIAFAEPFHISYFHHSPLAVHELLETTGFRAEHYILSANWHAFLAHMEMGYAGARWPAWMRRGLAGTAAAFGLAPAWVRSRILGQHARWEEDRLAFARSHAAFVGFVARREGEAPTRLRRPLSVA